MQFLFEYGLFIAKVLTVVVAILMVVGSVVSLVMRHKKSSGQQLEVTHLNRQYDEMERLLSGALLSPQQLKQKLKAHKKADKKADKAKAKADKKASKVAQDELAKNESAENETAKNETEQTESNQPADNSADNATDNPADNAQDKRIYVLDFEGDMRATEVDSLRQEVSAILTMASSADEVVVRLESSGGVVHGYGLAASQLQRIRDQKIPLTVAVDKVAASGGYMMACVADKIIAAPFAFIGSIGVLAQIPNLHRLLKKHEIDFEQLHAGEYKRTLTLFGENTDKGRAKVQQELEETHDLFKDYVKTQRPKLDIDKVATGEHWLGTRALELDLVDGLQTSDDYLMAARHHAQLIALCYTEKQNFMDRLTSAMSMRWRTSPALLAEQAERENRLFL